MVHQAVVAIIRSQQMLRIGEAGFIANQVLVDVLARFASWHCLLIGTV